MGFLDFSDDTACNLIKMSEFCVATSNKHILSTSNTNASLSSLTLAKYE